MAASCSPASWPWSIAGPACAQIGGSGSIQGTVFDPSGAVVAGATVVATNLATGVEATRATSGAGLYVVSPLTAGTYSVTVSAKGFKSVVQNEVVVDAQQRGRGERHAERRARGGGHGRGHGSAPQHHRRAARQTVRGEVYSALPAGDAQRRPAQPDLVHVPAARHAEHRPLGQRAWAARTSRTRSTSTASPITNATTQGEGRNLSFGISVEAIDQFQVETSGTAVSFGGQGSSNFVIKSGSNDLQGRRLQLPARQRPRRARLLRAARRGGRQDQARPDAEGVRLHARRPPPEEPHLLLPVVRGLPRHARDPAPADLDPAARLAERRLQLAACDDLRPGSPRGRTRTAPASSATRSPGTSSRRTASRRSRRTSSRSCPTPRTANLQNNYSGSLPTGFKNDSVDAEARRRTCRPRTSSRCSSGTARTARRRRTPAARARRRQRHAAAVHQHAPRRADPVARPAEAHLGRELAHGEPGEPRLLAAGGADHQRDHRRPLPAGGRAHRPARGRGRLRVPGDRVRGPERAPRLARHRLARVLRAAGELHASSTTCR